MRKNQRTEREIQEAARIGEIIGDLREQRNWSQDQLAEKLGLNRTTIWRIETGRVLATKKTRQNLAALFEVPGPTFQPNLFEEAPLPDSNNLGAFIRQNRLK